MNIQNIPLKDLKTYENNARQQKDAVKYIANSIREFGFNQPIIIDKSNVIVCGHQRYEAAKILKLKEIPCVVADELTDDEVKAFRFAENKTREIATWDSGKLEMELMDIGIDMTDFGFNAGDDEAKEEKISDGGEVSLSEFEDEKFKYVCPCCGFAFNKGVKA